MQALKPKVELNVKDRAEMDEMEHLLAHRKEQLAKAGQILSSVHDIAKQIHNEVTDQGTKVKKIEEHMQVADENVELGNEQLQITNNRKIFSGKMLKGVFLCAAIFVAILILIIIIRR